MRVDVVARPEAPHQVEHAAAMRAGLDRQGVCGDVVNGPNKVRSETVVCWGWAIGQQLHRAGHNVMVMERGYIGDRMRWTSLGWNGLNGRAKFPEAPDDGGARFREHFPGALKPYNTFGLYVLLIGQVPGDASLNGLDLEPWYAQQARAAAVTWGLPVRFRPHPVALEHGYGASVAGCETDTGPLDEALAGAACVITWNSNAGVDALLAGKFVTVADRGSMAWGVMEHEREAWAHALVWRQFTIEEIASGFAWERAQS